MNEEFISSKNGLDLNCHNHFQEIRFQLDQHREELKEKIDNIYMEMIEKTKAYEASYLNGFKDDLKKLEKTFRNPNLLIKEIKEIQLKQENGIKSIRLKLNEISLIREHLKASNQFKPNYALNNDLFGRLYLGEYSNFDN